MVTIEKKGHKYLMNLLLLTSSFPRHEGDFAGNFVYELARRLQVNGLDTTILCPHHPGARLRESMSGLTVWRFPYFYPFSCQKLYSDGGIVYNFINSRMAKIQLPLFLFSEFFYTMKIIKKNKINVINSHWFIPQGLVAAIFKKIIGIAHVATIHSSEITMIKKIPAGRRIAEFIVNNSDVIISVSSHRAKELLSFISSEVSNSVKDKILIIPMGIDLRKFRYKTDEKHKLLAKYGIHKKSVVLFIGRLIEVKGCEYLIRSFKTLKENIEDVDLLIVGSGPLESELRKIVQDLCIENYVRFEGFVEHSRVADYYSLADVVVFPSIVDSGYREGLPVALLEALATGKAVVATRTGGFFEVIEEGQNGFLVKSKNPEQIAGRVSLLLSDKELRAKFSKKALESSMKYDLDFIAGKYIEIFRGNTVR